MNILAIDTSCDETAAAVTNDTKILSNIIWSQASLHTKFGGVMPSLAQRMHEERIDFVIQKALTQAKVKIENIDAIAVTIGPGLAIALGIGIDRAKKIAEKYQKKILAINHVKAHILSPLARPGNANNLSITNTQLPTLGLCVSGKNTLLVKISEIEKYEILAQTVDDALGEALDKAARMLGLGYPGGAVLEKFAKLGNPKKYSLPIPMAGQEVRQIFSYSGLKTAFARLVENEKPLTKEKIYDLAACFQDVAIKHLVRVMRYILTNNYPLIPNHFFVGGGVANNVELRKRLRNLAKEFNIAMHFPYSNKLYCDNAAMIGVSAYFKALRGEFSRLEDVDRNPNLKIDN